MTTNHTPTPWHVSGLCNVCANATQGGALTGALQDHVAECENPADSAYIVRCVNAHDDLVAALRACVANLDGTDVEMTNNDALKIARAALAKVTK